MNRPVRYLVQNAVDIRRGDEAVAPGWIIGPFREANDLRWSEDFEIKEWEAATAQGQWKNHSDTGTEYIAVFEGILTVVIGAIGNDGVSVEPEATIAVASGQRLTIGSEVWRRYEASPDAKGISIRRPPNRGDGEPIERYRAFNEHWKHTDQIRQWLLYNCLMASSVLVIGWSALYVADKTPIFLLMAVSLLGAIASFVWLAIVTRASGYYDMYENNGLTLEKGLRNPTSWPFHQRRRFRSEQMQMMMKFKFAHVSQIIPFLFLLFYLLTFYYDLARR